MQDAIDPLFQVGNVTHAFIIGTSNENLKSVCNNSRGFYEEIV